MKKWWGLLAGKVLLLMGLHMGMLVLVSGLFPGHKLAKDLAYTFSVMGIDVVLLLLGYALWMDQKFRCRVCLHRLRMPVAKGNWSRNLFSEPPELEWICPFGHGAMHLNHAQLISAKPDHWTSNDDNFWRAFEDAWKKD
jgi:hypothetical protein